MSKFSFEEFKTFLSDKNATFYAFDETDTYCKGVNGAEDAMHYQNRLFKEPIADGEHHIDALYAITRRVSSVTGRTRFDCHPSYRCIAFVVDGATLYRFDNWFRELIPTNTITQELPFSPLYNELADYLRQTISGKKYLKDPKVVAAARDFAAEKYIFGKKKSATREACQKQLGLFPSTDDIVEYLANPSTWVDSIIKVIDDIPRALNFTKWRRETAAAIDSLVNSNSISFSQDYMDFLNVCKDMYNAIKDNSSVIIVLKANGKSKCVQYRTAYFYFESWPLIERRQISCFGAEPDDKAICSLQNFLKQNCPKYNSNALSAFPFTTIEKILDVNTKKTIWNNPMFKEETK